MITPRQRIDGHRESARKIPALMIAAAKSGDTQVFALLDFRLQQMLTFLVEHTSGAERKSMQKLLDDEGLRQGESKTILNSAEVRELVARKEAEREAVQMRLNQLREQLFAASMARKKATFRKVEAEYAAAAKAFAKLNCGPKGLGSGRKKEIVARIEAWDAAMAAGRLTEARALVPEESPAARGFYDQKLLAGLFADYYGKPCRFTAHPPPVGGKKLKQSLGAVHANDNRRTVAYDIHLNGERSDFWVEFSYEDYFSTWGLFLFSLTTG